MDSSSIKPRRLTIRTSPSFGFRRTVQGHGWFDLPPFSWDESRLTLTRAIRLPAAGPAVVSLRDGAGGVRAQVVAARDPGRADLEHARGVVARMLRLDETFDPFYETARRVARPDLRWTERVGAGRLLRSPSVYEDLVKMICTTNCSWALTRVMTSALVSRLGEEAPGGRRLFPTPEAMARAPRRFYRDTVKAGYRAPFLVDLARSVSRGGLDPESWLDPSRPTTGIREEILAIGGAGPYVADNMLKLLGRYEGLGVDSWCRRTFSRMYRPRRQATDAAIGRFYEPFGKWRGLALWCDMTRDWFDDHGRPLGQDKFPGLSRDRGG